MEIDVNEYVERFKGLFNIMASLYNWVPEYEVGQDEDGNPTIKVKILDFSASWKITRQDYASDADRLMFAFKDMVILAYTRQYKKED